MSEANLIRAIRAEHWDAASVQNTLAHFQFNAKSRMDIRGATKLSGWWYQAADYLQTSTAPQPTLRQFLQFIKTGELE